MPKNETKIRKKPGRPRKKTVRKLPRDKFTKKEYLKWLRGRHKSVKIRQK